MIKSSLKRNIPTTTIILALLLLMIVDTLFVSSSLANFTTPPPELPYAYITVDGSIEPKTLGIQHVGDTYIFIENLSNYTLVIERNNIIVDGAGYTIQGNSSGKGIVLTNIHNVTIKNIMIKNFAEGVVSKQSSENIISQNTITDCYVAIHFISASNNTVIGNNITGSINAIDLYGSSNNNIIENQITESKFEGIRLDFGYESTYYSNLTFSSYCNIIRNNLTSNLETGINVIASSYSQIEDNLIVGSENGIIFAENTLQYNNIINNTILNNTRGIYLMGNSLFNITGNYIAHNTYGIYLSSSNNLFVHNDFINNQKHVMIPSDKTTMNLWDNGKEGNFWSNYNGTDLNSDGIGDSAYVIDANNIDNYPLMNPITTSSQTETEFKENIFSCLSVVAVSVVVVIAMIASLLYFKKHKHSVVKKL